MVNLKLKCTKKIWISNLWNSNNEAINKAVITGTNYPKKEHHEYEQQ